MPRRTSATPARWWSLCRLRERQQRAPQLAPALGPELAAPARLDARDPRPALSESPQSVGRVDDPLGATVVGVAHASDQTDGLELVHDLGYRLSRQPGAL